MNIRVKVPNSRLLRTLLLLLVGAIALQPGRVKAQDAGPFTITSNGTTLGTVTFDTYQDRSDKTVSWSVELKGGFDASKDCVLKDGYSYRWVQAVKLSQKFYSWNTPDEWFIDRTRDAIDDKKVADKSPFYVNLRGPGYGHDTLGYFDKPNLPVGSFPAPISFMFETALVCAQAPPDVSDPSKKRDIFLIDSFTWGASVDKDGKVTLQALTQTGMVSDNLITAFNNDPDKDTFSKSWNLQRGNCCVTPEGSSLLALLAGVTPLVFGGLRKRRNRARSRSVS